MMRKLIFIVFVIASLVSQAQSWNGDFLNTRKRFTIKNYWVTDIKNDTFNWNSSGPRYLPTAKAVYDFVTGRTAGIVGGTDGWKKTGNAGTIPGTDFIGTIDSADLEFRVNNQLSAKMTTSDKGNNSFGLLALSSVSTGFSNNAFGLSALRKNATGGKNIAIGVNSLYENVSGSDNIAIGHWTLKSNINSSNIGIGTQALYLNTTGTGNIAVGTNALILNVITSDNIALGNYALYNHVTNNGNTSIGHFSLYQDTSGFYNTAIGYYAMYGNKSGQQNTTVGASSLRFNTTGDKNSAFGAGALENNTTGGFNVGLGQDALLSNTTGFRNIGIGWNGFANNFTGYQNIGIGYGAGKFITYGVNNTIIGSFAGWSTGQKDTITNSIAIGAFAVADKDNQTVIGTNSTKEYKIYGKGNLPNYGTGLNTGVLTYRLGVNSSGDVIEDTTEIVGSMVYPGVGIPTSTGTAWGASIADNSANWNTAFGWGNHAGIYPTIARLIDSLLAHTSRFNDVTGFLAGKNETLVSGSNIKTVNGTSLLGSGNVTVGTDGYVSSGSFNTTTNTLTLVQTGAGNVNISIPATSIKNPIDPDSLVRQIDSNTLIVKAVKAKSNSADINVSMTHTDTTGVIEISSAAIGQPIATFSAGAGIAGDTLLFTDSTLYGSFYTALDSFYITGAYAVLKGQAGDTVGIQIVWNDSINVTGTVLNGATIAVNSLTTGNSFSISSNGAIPPGMWVWMKSPTVVSGKKPEYLSVTLIGYRRYIAP